MKVSSQEVEQFVSGCGVVDSTAKNHRRYIQRLLEYADGVKGNPETGPVIRAYLSTLPPHARKRAWGVLRQFFFWRIQAGLAVASPIAGIPKPKAYGKAKVGLPRRDLVAIVETLDGMIRQGRTLQYRFSAIREKAVIRLALVYGLRVGEICRLDFSDWNGHALIVRRKGGENITVTLDEVTLVVLQAYVRERSMVEREDKEAIFIGWWARRLTREAVRMHLDEIARKAGVTLPRGGLHQFRHTMAGIMLQEGLSIQQVAQYLGHRSLSSTDHYCRQHFGTKSRDGLEMLEKVMEAGRGEGASVTPLRAVSTVSGPQAAPGTKPDDPDDINF